MSTSHAKHKYKIPELFTYGLTTCGQPVEVLVDFNFSLIPSVRLPMYQI